MDNFYGIRQSKFIWHGETADPEILYKKHLFDYYDLEDYLWSCYQEDEGEGAPEDKFDDFVKQNAVSAKSFLDDLYALRMEQKREELREAKEHQKAAT